MFRNFTLLGKFLLGYLPIIAFIVAVGAVNPVTLVGAILVAVISALALEWFITRPILALNQTVKEFSRGVLVPGAEIRSRDEIGMLAQSVNTMASTLSEAQRLPESILRSMKDALFVINNEGVIVEVNEAALETLGYTREEMIGKPIPTVFQSGRTKRVLHS